MGVPQDGGGARMIEFDIKSPAFQQAELRSERARVGALLGVLGSLLALVLIRGAASLAQGHSGEAWPFALLLAAMIGYEAAWLLYVRRAIRSGWSISRGGWRSGVIVETLLPTVALFLQIHTSFVGPQRALVSPVVLAYFLFIVLSTLHLDSGLSRLAGGCSAAGYAAVSAYVFLVFPQSAAGEEVLAYATSFSYAALLLVGGFAAGSVADQIRQHVLAALRDVESRAKIAQMERDLGVARSVQQCLLPKTPPQIEGFDVAGWNQPADETGGDYFDWQQLEDGRVAFTVADVTGHGVGPALCMAACRAYARAIFAAQTDLRRAFSRLNHLLCEDLPSERFVTLAAGLLDPEEATLELISAGHGPLLFYLSAENRFRSYDAQGLPLGLMPDAKYGSPQILTFAPGDIFALITDGFIEWANPQGEQFGEKRLREVIRRNRDRPAATIISELYSSLLDFAGTAPQQDDLTILIVKRA
jgi:serine phosphatase RsbU (regulator of sigma subunit)